MFLNCKEDARDKNLTTSKKVNTAHVIAQETLDVITCESEIIDGLSHASKGKVISLLN